jgi:oxygen-independent coproporphyrinogen-3 oxidase
VFNLKELGIYIHIPFCKQKCYYCDFVSFPLNKEFQKNYITQLKKEINNFLEKNKEIKITSIYIGGGTPSYIDSKYIKEILGLFDFSKDIEVTIEVNPGTVTLEKLKDYKEAGINRLSIGLQSTEDRLLKMLGRIHNFDKFLETYKLAKEIGFDNINVDLMIGLPNQSIEDIKKSLEEVTKLEPKHVSVYSLIVEEDTVISKKIEREELKLPDEEQERNMYWYVKNFLELHGYNHYEISNFALNGFQSKHNLDCWEQKEYRGFGLAAHSYIDKVRFANTNRLEEYMENCEQEDFDVNEIIQEVQDEYMQQQEYMLIGLRKIDGVSIQDFKNKFGENPIFVFRNELNKLVEEQLLQISSDRIKLTNKGLDLANIVWEEFV